MRRPDSRRSKKRVGYLRLFSRPPVHRKVEFGVKFKETQSSCTSNWARGNGLKIVVFLLG